MVTAIVVDDDKDVVESFTKMLKSNNIDVVGKAYDGKEAVELYQKLKPDVAYLDVTMPVFDGIYALQKIRELNLDAVIIMLADNITLNNEMAMNRLNPSAVIHEPIDINEIIKKNHHISSL